MKQKLSSLSVVFPAYNDQFSIPKLIEKTFSLLPKIADKYEIIIINDGSKDKTLEVLKVLKKKNPCLKIINHRENRGYGATLIDGFKRASGEFIFYTDGDGQYDVSEITKLIKRLNGKTDMVTGYKIKRADSKLRKVFGFFYNKLVKTTYGLRVRDVDCDFRLFRRKIIKDLNFHIASGAFDAEFIKYLQDRNVRIKEVPIHHYPRSYGQSQFFRPKNIIKSLWDLTRL